MSQITCCPACGTMFRVVADQLRISEGWVRCGHCTEVFDATAQMQDGDRAPTQQAEPARAATEAAEARPAALEQAAAPEPVAMAPRQAVEPPPASDDGEAPVRFQPSVLPDETELTPGLRPGARPVTERGGEDSVSSTMPSGWNEGEAHGYPPFELRRADPGDDEPEDFFTPPDVNSGWTSPEADPAPEEEDVSFIRDARRRAFWRRPLVRVAVAAFAIGLAALLAAQIVVHDRHRLVALHPQLAPIVRVLCQPLGCTLGPLRRIEAIAIDSSAFNKLRPDVYRLSVSLKNQGAAAVAMPALELTLTDAQDQPVLRRVLAARELGATSEVIAGNGEWSTAVSLTVAANGNAERIAGYRLLAFYP